jgi:excisionase family DNA binding protein
MERLYDVNGAAQLLAVSPWTVRAYIRQGKLRAVRIGRLVRLEVSAIQSFVDAARGSSVVEQNPNHEGAQQ